MRPKLLGFNREKHEQQDKNAIWQDSPDEQPGFPSRQVMNEPQRKRVVLLGHHNVITDANGGGFGRHKVVVKQKIQALLARNVEILWHKPDGSQQRAHTQ